MFPSYQPSYQASFNPYIPQMPTIPQAAPQSGLTGHLVASQEDIKPQDVPMNGQAAYFPSQDGSVIYAKAWNPDGSIATVRYIPDVQPDNSTPQPTLFDIANQLSTIEDLLTAKPKPATRKTAAKKEAEDE